MKIVIALYSKLHFHVLQDHILYSQVPFSYLSLEPIKC